MNKTVKRALLIAGGVVAACGIIWGGLTLARNAQRGNVDVYAVSDFAMTDYWGDTSQTSGMVSTDKMQKIYLSSTQKVSKIYVEEGQTVKKGDKLLVEAVVEGYSELIKELLETHPVGKNPLGFRNPLGYNGFNGGAYPTFDKDPDEKGRPTYYKK